jgi:hypothetical protein
MQAISSIRRDFIASNLRSQINRLRHLLNSLEEENDLEFNYTDQSLKDIEIKIRQIRRLCSENSY